MRTWYSVLFFFLMMSTVLGGVHYYLWRELIRAPRWTPRPRRALTAGLVLLFALLMGSFPAYRLLRPEVAAPLVFVSFTWLGIMFLLFVATLARHGLHHAAGRVSRVNVDPGRRLFLQRTSALGVGVLTTGASAVSIQKALDSLHVREVDVRHEKLAAGWAPLRIALVTDIHVGATIGREFVTAMVERINTLDADLVAITGDLVDGSVPDLAPHVAPLAGLRSRHGTFFVPGNHEYYSGLDAWLAHLGSLGIRTLRNERVTLDHHGHAFDVAGIDDPTGNPDMPRTVAGRNPETPLLVLAHQPRAVRHTAGHGGLLQLSGHTHGGQIWPFNFLVRIVQPYVEGLHRHNDGMFVYVSPGTGYWGPAMRLGTKAEITAVTLARA